jgi:hypothetical protein
MAKIIIGRAHLPKVDAISNTLGHGPMFLETRPTEIIGKFGLNALFIELNSREPIQ